MIWSRTDMVGYFSRSRWRVSRWFLQIVFEHLIILKNTCWIWSQTSGLTSRNALHLDLCVIPHNILVHYMRNDDCGSIRAQTCVLVHRRSGNGRLTTHKIDRDDMHRNRIVRALFLHLFSRALRECVFLHVNAFKHVRCVLSGIYSTFARIFPHLFGVF